MDAIEPFLGEILEIDATPETLCLVLSKLKDAGHLDLVIQQGRKALNVHPDHLGLRMLLAEAYMENGLAARASEEMERVTRRIDEMSDAYRRLADAYLRQGRELEAARCLSVYLAHREDEEARETLSRLLAEPAQDAVPEAAPAGAAMEVPEREDETLGTIMGSAEKEEAEPLEVAMEAEEEEEELLEAAIGAEEEEEESLEAAMGAGEELPGPEVPEIATPTLAELYVNQGQIESAVEIYRKILDRDPADERARNRLSELEGLGQEPEFVEAAPDEFQEADVDDTEKRKTERVIAVLEEWLHRIQGSRPQASA